MVLKFVMVKYLKRIDFGIILQKETSMRWKGFHYTCNIAMRLQTNVVATKSVQNVQIFNKKSKTFKRFSQSSLDTLCFILDIDKRKQFNLKLYLQLWKLSLTSLRRKYIAWYRQKEYRCGSITSVTEVKKQAFWVSKSWT